MRIAVIGAGFCGLAVTWHLLNQEHSNERTVTLFDQSGIGCGTSGIAAGLLHPFAGAHAKLNRWGKEGLEATQHLLDVASQFLGESVIAPLGILRPALTELQQTDYQQCAKKHSEDVEWWKAERCQAKIPGLIPTPGLFIKDGLTIKTGLYLQGLWLACQYKGAHFEQRTISNLEELSHFDQIVVATGADTTALIDLPLKKIKGQILELEWPNTLPPLPFALNSVAYLIMSADNKTCLAGSTFEKDKEIASVDETYAINEIMPKIIAFMPALENTRVINCYAGMRSVTPDHLPIIKQMNDKTWVLAGMGSKGLLYHALMARQLVEKIILQKM